MAWLSTEFYYYKGSAPCRAVWMTLKMLKVEYEDKQVDLLKAENKRPWFVRVSPRAKGKGRGVGTRERGGKGKRRRGK